MAAGIGKGPTWPTGFGLVGNGKPVMAMVRNGQWRYKVVEVMDHALEPRYDFTYSTYTA